MDTGNAQALAMGLLCFIYGGFIAILGIAIPNSLGGRLSFFFCGLVIGGIGYALRRSGKRNSQT